MRLVSHPPYSGYGVERVNCISSFICGRNSSAIGGCYNVVSLLFPSGQCFVVVFVCMGGGVGGWRGMICTF